MCSPGVVRAAEMKCLIAPTVSCRRKRIRPSSFIAPLCDGSSASARSWWARAETRSPRASATLPERKCTSGSFGASDRASAAADAAKAGCPAASAACATHTCVCQYEGASRRDSAAARSASTWLPKCIRALEASRCGHSSPDSMAAARLAASTASA